MERKNERDLGERGEAGGGNSVASYAGMGLQFVAAILLFLYAGQWLDGRLGTSPLFVLVGVFVGGGGAFYGMYRKLMAAQAADAAARRR